MEVDYSFDEELLSFDIKERTVRFHLFGKGAAFLTRRDFVTILREKGADDLIGVWKGESPFEVFATFESRTTAQRFLQDFATFMIGETTVFTSAQDDILNVVKVFWAPFSVRQSFFDTYFTRKGFQVISSRVEEEEGLYSGTRSFKLVGTKAAWDGLPHMVDFCHFKFQALIAVTGRPPLCLRCKKVGHRRANCDQNRAAQFVASQQQQQQKQQQQQQQRNQPKPQPRTSQQTRGQQQASGQKRVLPRDPRMQQTEEKQQGGEKMEEGEGEKQKTEMPVRRWETVKRKGEEGRDDSETDSGDDLRLVIVPGGDIEPAEVVVEGGGMMDGEWQTRRPTGSRAKKHKQ